MHVPENEDHIYQQLVELSPLLHCVEQHYQLAFQVRQEAKQPLKPQHTQYAQTTRPLALSFADDLTKTRNNTRDQSQSDYSVATVTNGPV